MKITFFANTRKRKSNIDITRETVSDIIIKGSTIKVEKLTKGTQITDTVDGETVTSDDWYIDAQGNYYWAGWTREVDRRIIFNVDDFGVSNFINMGVEEGIRIGIVNSVSTFVTFGDQQLAAIRKLHTEFKHKIKIGLHFTISAGSPVSKKVESLIYKKGENSGSNKFRNVRDIIGYNNIEPEEFKKELVSQIELLGAQLGGVENIDHVNMHQNLANFSNDLWDAFLSVVGREGYKFPIRTPRRFETFHKKAKKEIKDITKNNSLPITKTAIKSVKGYKAPGLWLKPFDSWQPKPFRGKKRQKDLCRRVPWTIKMSSFFVTSYYGQPHIGIIKKILENIEEGECIEFMLHLASDEKVDLEKEYKNTNYWGLTLESLIHRPGELKVLKENIEYINQLLDWHGIIKVNYQEHNNRPIEVIPMDGEDDIIVEYINGEKIEFSEDDIRILI